jgi:sialidase-1
MSLMRKCPSPSLFLGLFIFAAIPANSAPPHAEATKVCEISDPLLNEVSGLASSQHHPGMLWMHNDSGDVARIFLVDSEGQTRAIVSLSGIQAVDWEDMCSFRFADENWLLIGDCGDNQKIRTGASRPCQLHLIREPRPDLSDSANHVEVIVSVHATIRFDYPDGPRDCESLAVDLQRKEILLLTKQAPTQAGLYSLPLDLSPGQSDVTLERLTSLGMPFATAMDLSPDGRTLAIATMALGSVIERRDGEPWAEACQRPPQIISLPPRRQGESLCFAADGSCVFLNSEHVGQPLWQLTLAPSSSTVEKTTVFEAGDADVALYRIPGTVVTQKGTVLAYCEARRQSRADWGEIEVHLRRSTDDGVTWEPPQHIAHRGARIEGNPPKVKDGQHEQTVNNPVAIVDHTTGAIEFLYCVNYARCFSMRSEDDGLTWSDPVEITHVFEPFRKHYDWKVIATGPGHGIQLSKTGRLVVPIWLAYGKPGDHKPSASATIYSDDHGRTWHAGELAVPDKGEFGDPNETMITELSDGSVMLVSRSVSRANRKLITISPDGATQWSRPRFHEQLWEPICMASIVAHPDSPGALLFSNPHRLALNEKGEEIPAGRGKRENLSIKLSRDDGKTWIAGKTLEAGPSAYSDLAVLPDGRILCLYEADNRIVAARFALDWVLSP